MSARFFELTHPFVWTTPADRDAVLANVNEPVWHRFLEEAERHFAERGGLAPAKFPAFCHDGDLDEVMAAAVLAYVRHDEKIYAGLADWLRAFAAYFQQARPGWRANRLAILAGRGPAGQNPGQLFEGFTGANHYWVEAGFMSVALHLLDLLEADAPHLLTTHEKELACAALADFADRFAFHEEAVKYSNRGLWGNAGLQIAALTHADPAAARVLFERSARRNREYRTTFFDDGMHGEGAPDYHLMSVDGLLCYALTASHVWPEKSFYAPIDDDDPVFPRAPGLDDMVRAYLRTVVPGPSPWNHPRGCSVSIPVPLRTSLVAAYQRTRDPEIGWFIQQRMAEPERDFFTPLKVTPSVLLGLGHYQPLLNFWLYRRIEETRPPARHFDMLPDHGAVFSRSGWDAGASCVAVRFGYEGTGKGHRDHAHVTATLGGREILSDPFPRFGPKGLETSLFHNTVTLDRAEPSPVIGQLLHMCQLDGLDAFLVKNSGGSLPDRAYLHDPRDESNYWFTNHPREPDFQFQRAVLHLHGQGLILIDDLTREIPSDTEPCIDWFFHTPLRPEGYAPEAPSWGETYRLCRRNVVSAEETLDLEFHGDPTPIAASAWHLIPLLDDIPCAELLMFSPDARVQVALGHHTTMSRRSTQGISEWEETDYFLRCRVEAASARVVWMLRWSDDFPQISFENEPSSFNLRVENGPASREISLHFPTSQLTVV